MRLAALIVGLLLTWLAATSAQAREETTRGVAEPRVLALLVGAEAYGVDPLGLGALDGPANDARLMAETLMEGAGARPEHLIVLTGGPGAPDAADRRGILAALARLDDTARRGDQVVIHLSGHGWRQTEAVPGSEPDGMDELFLPVGYSLDGDGLAVGLLDDEIGAVVDSLRARGADVVFIGDFCHAGDATRGRPDFTPRWRDSRLDLVEAGPGAGSYVAFFAAPAAGRAMQGLAPIWAPVEDRRPHGLLSVYLATALRDPSVRTWSEAAARVQADLMDHDVRDRAVRLDGPAAFEGALDGLLPGRAATGEAGWIVPKPALRVEGDRVALDGLPISAGALHGLAEGDRLALSEAGVEPRVILYARVRDVTATEARLVPDAGRDAAAWADIRARDGRPYSQEALWIARRVARGAVEPVRLSVADADMAGRVAFGPLGLVRAQTDDPADLYLAAEDDGAVLATAPVTASRPSIDGATLAHLSAADADTLTTALTRAVRAHRMRALLSRLAEAGGGGDLVMEPFLWRPEDGDGEACPPFDPTHAVADTPPPEARRFADLGLAGPSLPVLQACDVIFLQVRNQGAADLDVTVLNLSADGAVWALPWLDGRPAVRFEPGRARVAAVQIEAAGAERRVDEAVMLVAVQVDPYSPPVSFAGLAQPAIGDPAPLSDRERTRGQTPRTELEQLLDLARFEPTRSIPAPTAAGRSRVISLPWRVTPAT